MQRITSEMKKVVSLVIEWGSGGEPPGLRRILIHMAQRGCGHFGNNYQYFHLFPGQVLYNGK